MEYRKMEGKDHVAKDLKCPHTKGRKMQGNMVGRMHEKWKYGVGIHRGNEGLCYCSKHEWILLLCFCYFFGSSSFDHKKRYESGRDMNTSHKREGKNMKWRKCMG